MKDQTESLEEDGHGRIKQQIRKVINSYVLLGLAVVLPVSRGEGTQRKMDLGGSPFLEGSPRWTSHQHLTALRPWDGFALVHTITSGLGFDCVFRALSFQFCVCSIC